MQNIGFYPNIDRDRGLAKTRALICYVIAQGRRAYIDDAFYPALADTGVLPAEGTLGAKADCIVVLGGDGTILHAAQLAAVHNKSLIGFNLGNLGYLTDADADGAEAALGKVLAGAYTMEKRMMLNVEIEGFTPDSPLFALNDVCVVRGALSKMVGCRVFVNDDYIDTYHADGVIVCTPTGSTAYSLSAGGPILKPDSDMLAVTPICPHALYARSSVVSAEDSVTIRTVENAEASPMLVSVDGRSICTIGGNTAIRVTRSPLYTTILRTTTLGFYDILRSKMLGNNGRMPGIMESQ